MKPERGQVSVTTENIFPIIRQWLYSDRDIFLRELASNAVDAIAKLRRLIAAGEAEGENETLKIEIVYDPAASTLTVADNGIGMTADEIRRYINQIAYSGVVDFVEKYKDKGVESDGIIGHFGLGFYSAFMVSDKVRIDTRSYLADAPAASWESEDGISYELGESQRAERGTLITLTLSEEGKTFLEKQDPRSILEKYCSFMPEPIYYRRADEKTDVTEAASDVEDDQEDKSANVTATEEDGERPADAGSDAAGKSAAAKVEPKPINETQPLWLKTPRDCTDEEYKEFFRKTFRDYREPLFWIHLNMDYPFRLKGILYFPKTDNIYESLEGRIKVFYNQVFVADNVKEIIPEFLFLLKGVVDCPDLPLNVSRSFLQNDATVGKLSSHIVRKVADRLSQLFKDQRGDYERYWQDIGVFVKYGMMRDEKFYDRVKEIALFPTVDDGVKVLTDFSDTILYTPDPKQQVTYLEMARARKQPVAVMDQEIDNHFMSFLEYKNTGKRFKRIDADLASSDENKELGERLTGLFREVSGLEKLKVKVQALGGEALPAMIQESEESRRMQEMRRQFERMKTSDQPDDAFADMFAVDQVLVLNGDHSLVTRLQALADIPGDEQRTRMIARQIYDLARLGHGSLTSDELGAFLKRSVDVLDQISE